jgi:ubiquinone/menaquinone biosynthesis C-methylase UbiE
MSTAPDPSTAWQLDHDSAAAYERYLVPAIFAPFARSLVELTAPAPGERVLDVACGTGVVARHAAQAVGPHGRVVGVDVNPGMLAVAASLAPGIDWRQADACRLPFDDGVFDVALCEQALMFFPDRAAALGEMRRVLAPGGRVALSVWRGLEHNWFYAAFAAALERHAGAEAAAMMRSPFPDWGAGELRSALEEAGFAEVRIRLEIEAEAWPSPAELLRREAASSPLAGPIGALPAADREALIGDLAHALRDYIDDDRVVFPIETHVATGRAR